MAKAKHPASALTDEPLPITSITLEGVTAEGLPSKIGRFLDFTQAEDVLRTWAHQQARDWPQGAPIRAEVEFSRRLVFTCDLIADASGSVRERLPEIQRDFSDRSEAGLMSLQDQVAIALRVSLASREVSVEALRSRRIARIVLAYGEPA